MLEDGVGTKSYEKSSVGTWPSNAYVFNEERSYCENGGSITWDDNERIASLETRYAEKCFVYFDRYKNVVINNITITMTAPQAFEVSVDANAGTSSISSYYYCLENCESSQNWVTDGSTHTFSNLTFEQEYTVSVKVKDSKNEYSNVATATKTVPLLNASQLDYQNSNYTSCQNTKCALDELYNLY